jgi:hypothetical protein
MRVLEIMVAEANKLLAQAAEALKRKEYPAAEALQRQGCALLREAKVDETRLATEIETLANIHYTQKKFDQAADEYSEVVQTRKRILPANDYNILQPLFNLAKVHFEAQKYDLAEAEMREGLAIAESYIDSPQTTGFCLYQLGWLLYYVGKYRESEPYLVKSLAVCDSAFGRSHPQTLDALGALAVLYNNSPDLGKNAEAYFRQAIEASKPEPKLQEYHLCNLCRLGNLLDEAQRFHEADEIFLELLQLIKKDTNDGAPNNWWLTNSCVVYFRKRGKNDLIAEPPFSKVKSQDAYTKTVNDRLKHAEATLSDDDPELIEALLNAGNHETFEGNYQAAEPLLDRALALSTKIYGENASKTIFAFSRVSIVKRLLSKFDEAESAIQRALNGAKQYFRDDGLYPWTLTIFASLREAEKKFKEAVSICAEAVAEYERIFGFRSYETVEAIYRQSGLLLRTGNEAAAETAIRRAIGVMDEIENLSDPEKSDYLATLASILHATGRQSEADAIQRRADELFERSKQQDGFGIVGEQ